MTNNWKDLIEQYPRFASLIKEYRNDVKGALKHLKNSVYALPNSDVPASAQLFYQLFGLRGLSRLLSLLKMASPTYWLTHPN